jgi:hypothetical protein
MTPRNTSLFLMPVAVVNVGRAIPSVKTSSTTDSAFQLRYEVTLIWRLLMVSAGGNKQTEVREHGAAKNV